MKFPLSTSVATVRSAPLLLIDLETEEGITGRTYLFCYRPSVPRAIDVVLRDAVSVVKGEPVAPLDIGAKLARRFALVGVASVVRMALSGLDVALWDALAIAAGLPLATFLGAKPKPIPRWLMLWRLSCRGDRALNGDAPSPIASFFSVAGPRPKFRPMQPNPMAEKTSGLRFANVPRRRVSHLRRMSHLASNRHHDLSQERTDGLSTPSRGRTRVSTIEQRRDYTERGGANQAVTFNSYAAWARVAQSEIPLGVIGVPVQKGDASDRAVAIVFGVNDDAAVGLRHVF